MIDKCGRESERESEQVCGREPGKESEQACERKPDAALKEESAQSRAWSEQSVNSRLRQQLDFILEIDKEKKIGRQTYLSDGEHRENDAEHAWHMAIMAVLLAEYANEPVDVLRTVLMLLIHDIVEIDAGDTYAYDEEGKKTQEAREQRAADRIYGLLPEDQGEMLYDVWREFEEQKTPEARFARTLDNLQPMMLNAATDGKAWVEHGVHIDQILGRNRNTHLGSEKLWEYAKENWLQPNLESGHILGGDVEENSEDI